MPSPHDVSVQIDVTAESSRLPLLRRTLAVVLDDAGLEGDTVIDLTLALDAIAELVVSCSARSARLTCSVSTHVQCTDVRVVGHLADSLPLPTDGFAWHLIEAITENVSVTTGDRGRVEICCRKNHPRAA